MKTFNGIIGQRRALGFLKVMIEKSNVRQSLLFEGPLGVGKSLIADRFARSIATPADIHRFSPEGKTALHTIENLRALSEQVYLRTFGHGLSVFILENAHQMSPPAANALLKTLEEPTENAVIVLLTSHAGELLPTICSRCVRIPFSPLTKSQLRALIISKGGAAPNDQLGERILSFGRAGFALRSDTSSARARLKIMEKMIQIPMSYNAMHTYLRDLEKAMGQYVEEVPRRALSDKRWKDVAAASKEQLQKGAQAQAHLDLHEELEFFFEILLDQINQRAVDETSIWPYFPIRQLAEDLQRVLKLWQRGGRISQLLESLFFRYSFCNAD